MDFAKSLENGPHSTINRLVGHWAGIARLWFEPGPPHSEGPVKGKIEAVHSGRFAGHEYSTSIDGNYHQGNVLIGCDLADLQWQIAWTDTFHTGTEIMFSQGSAEDVSRIVALGSYLDENRQRWGWRTEINPGDDRLLIRHFNISPYPEDPELLAVEFEYMRTL